MYERGTMWCPKCGSTNTLATTLVEECLDCGFSKHYHYWDHAEPNFDSAYNKPIPEITTEYICSKVLKFKTALPMELSDSDMLDKICDDILRDLKVINPGVQYKMALRTMFFIGQMFN